jgi:transcriptional regulator with XRE-family HTH domain
LRKAARLSQTAAATAASLTQAHVSRIENGRAIPTPTEAEALARSYRATAAERRRLVALAETLAGQYVDARVILQAGAHHFQRRVHETEAKAAMVRSYQPAMVLGVLQTPAYARAVFTPDVELSEADAAASIASRLMRWKLLAEPTRQWRLLQTEAALRWVVGSYELMVEQLDHIAEAARLPTVRLGIIPLDTVSPRPAPLHGFHIYDDDSVLFGTETGTALLPDLRRVADFTRLFRDLERLAVFGDPAAELLESITATYRCKVHLK